MQAMHQMCATLNRVRPVAPLVLRVVIGFLFLWHGIDKFDAGLDMVEGMFRGWGVPAAGFTAPLTAVLEIVGGAALIVGLMTRLAAIALGGLMLAAIAYVKLDLGIISSEAMPGAQLDLALLAGLAAVIVLGPGVVSADARLGVEPDGVVAPVAASRPTDARRDLVGRR